MDFSWGQGSRLQYRSPPPTLHVCYAGKTVAELKKENGKYYFRYLSAFGELNLAPLPGLRNQSEESVHDELPLFFKERLPDFRRPEVRVWLDQNPKVDPNDDLQLLAALGAHSITDSFVLNQERVCA